MTGSYVKSMFYTFRNCQNVFQSCCTHLQSYFTWILVSPHLHHTWYGRSFSFYLFKKCMVGFIAVLLCIFLTNNVVELFSCVYLLSVHIFDHVPVQIFSIGFFVQFMLCRYFLPICGLSFPSFTVSFKELKLFILMQSNLSSFSFVDCAFIVICEKYLPNP